MIKLLAIIIVEQDLYKKLFHKVVSTYLSAIILVIDRFKAQEMCDKAADVCHFVFNSVFD